MKSSISWKFNSCIEKLEECVGKFAKFCRPIFHDPLEGGGFVIAPVSGENDVTKPFELLEPPTPSLMAIHDRDAMGSQIFGLPKEMGFPKNHP